MLSCIWTKSNKSERLMDLVGWFIWTNNTSPFFPIYHQLSPSSHSQHLKISFYFFSPSFPGSSSSSRPFQFLSEDFWASYPPPFSPGDPANLSFAPLSNLLHFLLYSTLLVLDSSYFLHVFHRAPYLSVGITHMHRMGMQSCDVSG